MAATRPWTLIWFAALAFAVAWLLSFEIGDRNAGFAAQVVDSKQLWALQRDRVYDVGNGVPVALLGASRSVYGLDPKVWRNDVPAQKPLMLAVNGHHPIATLRDLALDPNFRGYVLCDIDSFGLQRAYWSMQQPWVDYYHRSWTPSWRIHRIILTAWQRLATLGNPQLSWKERLRRVLSGTSYTPDYTSIDANRAGRIDFSQVDRAALAAAFDRGAVDKLTMPKSSPSEFLADMRVINGWVAQLQARGGDVVFIQTPVAGELRRLDRDYQPRAQYWDAFAALPHIKALHWQDVPALVALELPDHSHVTPADRVNLTRVVLDALRARGWLGLPES